MIVGTIDCVYKATVINSIWLVGKMENYLKGMNVHLKIQCEFNDNDM